MKSIPPLLLAALVFSACSSPTLKHYDTSPWKHFGYEGMAGKINRLTGPESVNCGIRNLIEPTDPVNMLLTPKESKTCVKASLQSGKPFRYGTIRIPTDSYLFSALVLDSSGEIWTIKYDWMIDGSGDSHFIKRCKSAKVDYSGFSYEGVDCKDVTTEEWLADIPEQNAQ